MLNTQFHVSNIFIDTPQHKYWLSDAGQIIVLILSGILIGRQLNGWRQQRDVDSEIERLRHLITRTVSHFHGQGMLSLWHIRRPGVIPNASRRTLDCSNPGRAAVNTQKNLFHIIRYRDLELRTHMFCHIIARDAAIVD